MKRATLACLSAIIMLFCTGEASAGTLDAMRFTATGFAVNCQSVPATSLDQARVNAACAATAARARSKSLNYSVTVARDSCTQLATDLVRCRTSATVAGKPYRAVVRVTGSNKASLTTRVTSWRKQKVKASVSSGYLHVGAAWNACVAYGSPSANATAAAYGWNLNPWGGHSGYTRSSDLKVFVWGTTTVNYINPQGNQPVIDMWCNVTGNTGQTDVVYAGNVSIGVSAPHY